MRWYFRMSTGEISSPSALAVTMTVNVSLSEPFESTYCSDSPFTPMNLPVSQIGKIIFMKYVKMKDPFTNLCAYQKFRKYGKGSHLHLKL